jgi:hypothetical protein
MRVACRFPAIFTLCSSTAADELLLVRGRPNLYIVSSEDQSVAIKLSSFALFKPLAMQQSSSYHQASAMLQSSSNHQVIELFNSFL